MNICLSADNLLNCVHRFSNYTMRVLGISLVIFCFSLILILYWSYCHFICHNAFEWIFMTWIVVNLLFNYSSTCFKSPGSPSPDAENNFKQCSKCTLRKPPRTHHCSVCDKCILKMDHHCPWINSCVGHRNHRTFMLFLVYCTLAALCYAIVSFPLAREAFVLKKTQSFGFILGIIFGFLITSILSIALIGMTGWTFYLISTGQTTIEHHDNGYQSKTARYRGEIFINEYDHGFWRNWILFLAHSPETPWWYLLLPIPVEPVGDGTRYETCREMLNKF